MIASMRRAGLVAGEPVAVDERADRILHYHRPPSMSRKFFSISFPCSVTIDSGWNCTPSTVSSLVADAHDHSALGVRGHLELRRQGLRRPRQRVVAHRRETVWQAGEDALAIVRDDRRLAVLDLACACDLAAVHVVDALVAEADAQHRRLSRERADYVPRDAGVVRVARPRRDDHVVGVQRVALRQCHLVVPVDHHVGAQLAQVLVQVVREAVVVIDQEHRHRSSPSSVARSLAMPRRAAASSSGE